MFIPHDDYIIFSLKGKVCAWVQIVPPETLGSGNVLPVFFTDVFFY
jgi:hypothetical protein